jgi:aminopeptidase N
MTSSTPLSPASTTVRLADYRAPAWTIVDAALVFELGGEFTEVDATLHLRCDVPGSPLRLDGEELELLEIQLNDRALEPHDYRLDATGLDVFAAQHLASATLRTRVRIAPASNTRLEGLYVSGSLLLTQCEAEGFRRITFFIDRPDVQARWHTTLRADAAQYPVLLGGGDRLSERVLDNGRHEAVWHNPHPTPCYLFALAAGPMARVSKSLVGADGRQVELNVWVEGEDPEPCRYALGAVERALRWDEQRFGRCYDLGVFNVVAAQDFTMGAMENKGLNIFNARYILADERTATDSDFMGIEAVVGHEYFHNWSGNRVTLRDWFQLSLKEGLTVFREQEFVADLHSRDLKRIDDVRLLRARQFSEDAGALAHPVRPSEYREINNFYTLTIYEKGAEIVRMLHARLGEDAFRAGMDRYFSENDGRCATLEDFFAAHAQASGVDCTDMLTWYAQAGTPVLAITRSFDAAIGTFTLVVRQPPLAELTTAKPLPIPFRVELYDTAGQVLGAPQHSSAERCTGAWLLREAEHVFVWNGLQAEPLPVFNQGFSAPVRVQFAHSAEGQARIVSVERDGFARWDALQGLSLCAMTLRAESTSPEVAQIEWALSEAMGTLLKDEAAHPAFLAECLALPDFDTLADAVACIDPLALLAAREAVLDRLAAAHQSRLSALYAAMASPAGGGLDDVSMSARALRHACLSWLARLDDGTLALSHWQSARSMTERLAALKALLHARGSGASGVLKAFSGEFADNPLVTDKWISLVATRPHASALDEVLDLMQGPFWVPSNPNRVRALVGSFARSNPTAFHRVDGAGYRFVAERIADIDAINPQVAARSLAAFESLPRWAPAYQHRAREALHALASVPRSRDVAELLERLRA